MSIPDGTYYMLGDNTQDSADSREWSFARFRFPASDVTGDGERELRGNLRRGENPLTVGFGDADGPKIRFLDEWGEPHWFRHGAAEKLSPEPAPFVPREMVQGKALAVFWPLDPRRSIYRLRWVN